MCVSFLWATRKSLLFSETALLDCSKEQDLGRLLNAGIDPTVFFLEKQRSRMMRKNRLFYNRIAIMSH